MIHRHYCLALAASGLMAPGIRGIWNWPPLKRVTVTVGPWAGPSSCQSLTATAR